MILGENAANSAVDALESVEALDGAALKLAGAVSNAVPVGVPRDALSGTWLGHALHPLLTDVVIGSFISATLLDLLGGDDTGRASERLIEVGLVAAAPTVASGLTDWALTVYGDRRTRPVGLVHASANLTASALYAASLAARRRGVPGRARLLSLAGGAALSVGGLLGGHLSFTRGVGVNETTFDEGPRDWTTVDTGELEDGKPTSGMAGDTPVLLLRHDGHLHALHDRCSHRGCELSAGQVEGESVTCPCHGSRFSLRDGSIEQGPATARQPVFETRESDGRIEVRLPAALGDRACVAALALSCRRSLRSAAGTAASRLRPRRRRARPASRRRGGRGGGALELKGLSPTHPLMRRAARTADRPWLRESLSQLARNRSGLTEPLAIARRPKQQRRQRLSSPCSRPINVPN